MARIWCAVILMLGCLTVDAVGFHAHADATSDAIAAFHRLVDELSKYQYVSAALSAPHQAVESASDWIGETIRPEAFPTGMPALLAHAGDVTTCDAIATTCMFKGRPVRLLQTRWLFVLVLDVRGVQPATPEAAAAFVSDVVRPGLRESERFNTDVHADGPGKFRGGQAEPVTPDGLKWLKWDWFDTLHWWLGPTELRMVFKKSGSEFVLYAGSSEKADNLAWFRYYPDLPGTKPARGQGDAASPK